jgi:4-amino-4-deoxy-L-arabinose transferase-like glycosyltransferase
MVFPGHPGLPMQIGLSLVQYALYVVGGGAESGLSFTEFVARRIESVWVASKILSTLLHLLSFVLLYRFARAILGSWRAALIATILYATTFPVLFYASRVSPEPWMVAFFCLTFLAFWGYQEATARGNTRRALTMVFVAAAAAVSAALSKAHLLGLFPFFCLAPLLAESPLAGNGPGWRRRLTAVSVFLGSAVAVTAAYSLAMDWDGFFRMWRAVTDSRGSGDSWVGALANRLSYVRGNLAPVAYLPRVSKAGVFALCELPFLVVSVAGLAGIRRDPPALRRFRGRPLRVPDPIHLHMRPRAR